MEYFVADFNIACPQGLLQTARDLLADTAGEAGFESFEDTAAGLRGYVQKPLLDRQVLDDGITAFPLEDTAITYNIYDAENKDWNEAWEKEGFGTESLSPWPLPRGEGSGMARVTKITIVPFKEDNDKTSTKVDKADTKVDKTSTKVDKTPAELITPLPSGEGIGGEASGEGPGGEASGEMAVGAAVGKAVGEAFIYLSPRLAFGTGSHETTQMIISTLMGMDVSGRRVLDCGCGTGILGIAAMRLGARETVAYDIDEWSVENTRLNARFNGISNITVLQGDATVLETVDGKFDIVLANINRNILLHDMPAFRDKMSEHAVLILSGFYTGDLPMLEEKARGLSLRLLCSHDKNDWCCAVFCGAR